MKIFDILKAFSHVTLFFLDTGVQFSVRSIYGNKSSGINRTRPLISIKGIDNLSQSSDDDLPSSRESELVPNQTILYETTESNYESSENSSVEMPVASTSANKTSKRKSVQWKLKNLSIDPNLIQWKMNDGQKQHV